MPQLMARNSLTDKKCQSLDPGRHSDGNGLYLEVKPSGTRSWSLIYQLNKKRRQMGLGPYPEVSLAEARLKSAERRKFVKVDKIDPMLAFIPDRCRQPDQAPNPSGL